jgi:dTDP-4-dehydrorhamnose 3,5-epimerase
LLTLKNEHGSASWRPLPGGAWLFCGKSFADQRGTSHEAVDLSNSPFRSPFTAVQENLVKTTFRGVARGLHYQVGPSAQAKLVSVVNGRAQFFWLPVQDINKHPTVRSIVLEAGATSLYTEPGCAHGFLALEAGTVFLLRMSRPVSLADRGEINLLAPDISIRFAVPLREDLLSKRDREAPSWSARRR